MVSVRLSLIDSNLVVPLMSLGGCGLGFGTTAHWCCGMPPFIHELRSKEVVGKGLSARTWEYFGANKTNWCGIVSKIPMQLFRCIFRF